MNDSLNTRNEPFLGETLPSDLPSGIAEDESKSAKPRFDAVEFELLGIDGQLKNVRIGDTALRLSYGPSVEYIPLTKITFVGTSHSSAYWPILFAIALGIYSLYQGVIKGNVMFGTLALAGSFLIVWLTYLGNKNKFLGRSYLAVKHEAGEEQFVSTQLDLSIQAFVSALIQRVR